jgi:hypothetical protein
MTIRFLLLTAAQAAEVGAIPTPGAHGDPRIIDNGPNAGDFTLSDGVRQDPLHAAKWHLLVDLPTIDLDPDAVFD